MTNLMLISESLTSGFSPLGLDILSFGAILSGILVITARNPVISVLFLIALFVNIAGYLILLGISFIGLAYITVYVGAIAILFLFVIFLLDIKLAELQQDNNKNSLPLGAIIGVAFLYPLYSIIPSNITEMKSFSYYVFNWLNSLITGTTPSLKFMSISSNEPSFTGLDNSNLESVAKLEVESVFTNLWDGNFAAFSQISSIGNVMYTGYLLWFFVASLILLLAMVAAISLTFKPAAVSNSH
uniref:NADH-ubiquinone oxidoreductase chain 6 n=1 Tax=Taphrina flavorubra JCM 22207 TaxID=1450759 RepID=A0A2Z5RE29_9ASCO|nr:NADH dehydrogenase subunit 6 [Taphrina flavorubra JCM 22207]